MNTKRTRTRKTKKECNIFVNEGRHGKTNDNFTQHHHLFSKHFIYRKLKLLPVFCEGPIGIGLVPDFNKSSAKLNLLSWTLLFNICTAAIPPFPAVCGAAAVIVKIVYKLCAPVFNK